MKMKLVGKILLTLLFCEACVQGKQHRNPFPESKSRSTEICNIIHADLCGPMEISSIGKSRYMFLLKDDFSHFDRSISYKINVKCIINYMNLY